MSRREEVLKLYDQSSFLLPRHNREKRIFDKKRPRCTVFFSWKVSNCLGDTAEQHYFPLPAPFLNVTFVTVCETTSNSNSSPVLSRIDSKIRSQTPRKLFKVLEPKGNKLRRNAARKPKCCNHTVFLTQLSVHTPETYWTAKTNTLSLSRSGSQTSSSVSPRYDMSHAACAHNKEKSTNQRAIRKHFIRLVE